MCKQSKILEQQKQANKFFVDVQSQQCWHLITEKTNILHICESLREHPKNITDFEKKKMLQKQN